MFGSPKKGSCSTATKKDRRFFRSTRAEDMDEWEKEHDHPTATQTSEWA